MKPARVPIDVNVIVDFAGQGMVLEPDDTLLIAFNVPLTAEQAEQVKDRLAAFAPDINLAIVDNVAGLAVQRAEG